MHRTSAFGQAKEQFMDDIERLADLFRALADPARLRILGAIADQPRSGRELADALKLTPPTISHHMHKLIEAGLVQVTTEGTRHTYRLDERALREAVRAQPASPGESPTGLDDEARERAKVLRDFFDGERLKSIPAQRKKRVVVLQHLVERFTPGEQYPERTINELLRSAHEDVATLRRELVDYGFMRREHGVYEVAQAPPERSVQVAQEFIGDERAWFERLVSGATRQALSKPPSD
jgi:DNA-binding HxlR family transcriptional regulator